MNQLVNSALFAYYVKAGEGKLKQPAKGRGPSLRLYDAMSEVERRGFHRMLSGLSAMQSVPIDAEEPDGTYYEYDRNLKATVKVTPDRERTPLVMLEGNVRHVAQKRLRKIAHEEITI
jgi:hypothetical protein